MNKYEVLVTVWSEEKNAQITVVAGTFDRFINAKLFADAYRKHYCSSNVEIIEYSNK